MIRESMRDPGGEDGDGEAEGWFVEKQNGLDWWRPLSARVEPATAAPTSVSTPSGTVSQCPGNIVG